MSYFKDKNIMNIEFGEDLNKDDLCQILNGKAYKRIELSKTPLTTTFTARSSVEIEFVDSDRFVILSKDITTALYDIRVGVIDSVNKTITFGTPVVVDPSVIGAPKFCRIDNNRIIILYQISTYTELISKVYSVVNSTITLLQNKTITYGADTYLQKIFPHPNTLNKCSFLVQGSGLYRINNIVFDGTNIIEATELAMSGTWCGFDDKLTLAYSYSNPTVSRYSCTGTNPVLLDTFNAGSQTNLMIIEIVDEVLFGYYNSASAWSLTLKKSSDLTSISGILPVGTSAGANTNFYWSNAANRQDWKAYALRLNSQLSIINKGHVSLYPDNIENMNMYEAYNHLEFLGVKSTLISGVSYSFTFTFMEYPNVITHAVKGKVIEDGTSGQTKRIALI